jgi:rhodanese-related sulfurtransferase
VETWQAHADEPVQLGIEGGRVKDRPNETTTVETLLEEAREGLTRLGPHEAREAQRRGAVLVDIRSESQQSQDGLLPGAIIVPRNVLEWRLDPSSPARDPALATRDRLVVLVCNQGYQSSLAAATLRKLGVDAADLIGGMQAWLAAGLPTVTSGASHAVDERHAD